MFSNVALLDTIAKYGLERAAAELGRLPPDFSKAPEWEICGFLAELLGSSESARRELVRYPLPDSVINPLSDSTISYMTTAALKNARTVDWLIRKFIGERRIRILDFACGTGRILRFLAQFAPEHYYSGCDVVPEAIDFIVETKIPGDHRLMNVEPPAPYNDGQFDLILAWSIFTHLSLPLHSSWLKDLHRMLTPGGILLATIHQSQLFDRMIDQDRYDREEMKKALAEYKSSGYGYFAAYKHLNVDGLDHARFGMAFISTDYIVRNWTKYFQIEEVGIAVDGWQDIVVLRARA